MDPDKLLEEMLRLCKRAEDGYSKDVTYNPLAVHMARTFRSIHSLMAYSNVAIGRHDFTPTMWRKDLPDEIRYKK